MYSPIHNCPPYIQEGSSLDCSCFAKDQGSPPGKVQWDTTGSAHLSRAIVSSADYGTQFTCNVIWNNTAEKSVTYTLYVTCKYILFMPFSYISVLRVNVCYCSRRDQKSRQTTLTLLVLTLVFLLLLFYYFYFILTFLLFNLLLLFYTALCYNN